MTHNESKPAEGEAFKTEHLNKRNTREQTDHVREDKRRPLRHQRRTGDIGMAAGVIAAREAVSAGTELALQGGTSNVRSGAQRLSR